MPRLECTEQPCGPVSTVQGLTIIWTDMLDPANPDHADLIRLARKWAAEAADSAAAKASSAAMDELTPWDRAFLEHDLAFVRNSQFRRQLRLVCARGLLAELLQDSSPSHPSEREPESGRIPPRPRFSPGR